VKRLLKEQKGFTLIELLIVIVILGVLAAAIIPNLSKFVGSGNVSAANAELAAVRTGLAGYLADHSGTAPTDGTAAEDFTILSAYMGNSSGLKANYTWDTSGIVTGIVAADTVWTKVAWDATSKLWETP
jgi:type IV pilus assembly protein PilA